MPPQSAIEPIRSHPFDALGRWPARLILLALVCFMIFASIDRSRPSTVPDEPLKEGQGDLAFWQSAIDRVHSGEHYYDVLASELRTRNYGMKSVANWRTPFFTCTMAILPTENARRSLLIGLGLLALGGSVQASRRHLGKMWPLCPIVVAGALAGAFLPTGYLAVEAWAGVCICLSMVAYATDRWRAGLISAAAALFLRELCLPYALLCAALAWREKRRSELFTWIGILICYGVYLGLHIHNVHAHLLATDQGYRSGWVCFGGIDFLLTVAGMNAYIAALGRTGAAIYFPLTLLGCFTWSQSRDSKVNPAIRLTLAAGGYMLLFAIVGKPFNGYWGMITAPLLAFGFAGAPGAIKSLTQSAIGPQSSEIRGAIAHGPSAV